MASSFDCSSQELIVLASTLAAALAKGQSPETIGRMAAFFTLLGDTLAVFALESSEP
ncbi:MAG: hypothetical protein ACOX7N_02710 [Lawsonibacter sp.]|jgi:hypothetical protein